MAWRAPTSQEATDAFYPGYAEAMTRIGRERGWPGMTRAAFDAGLSPRGHLLIGSPAEVVDKILFQHEHLRHDRFLMQMAVGPVPTAALMRSIELFGTKVAPEIRRALPKSARVAAEHRRRHRPRRSSMKASSWPGAMARRIRRASLMAFSIDSSLARKVLP